MTGTSKYLLGDSIKEAEETYNKYKGYLLKVCKNYSDWSGVDIRDLFGDAIIALAKAQESYDKNLSSFKTYAKYYILSALNDSIRKNSSVISLPHYLFKAKGLANKIQAILSKYNIRIDSEEFMLNDNNYFNLLTQEDKEAIFYLKTKLTNLALNSNTSYEDLIETVFNIPTVTHSIEDIEESYDNYPELLAKLLIASVKDNLTKDELTVFNYLLLGNSKSDLPKLTSRSKNWCYSKIASIKNKLIEVGGKDLLNAF